MMRVLRHKDVLKATIHTLQFRELFKNDKVARAVRDIENATFFKALYILLPAVFPAFRALKFTDSNKPMMDKIYFFSKRTESALEKSIEFLNCEEIFGDFTKGHPTLNEEIGEIWGG